MSAGSLFSPALARMKELMLAIQKASDDANAVNQQIAGLGQTPEQFRAQRLDELQAKRRDFVEAYYLAKEEAEKLTFFPPQDLG